MGALDFWGLTEVSLRGRYQNPVASFAPMPCGSIKRLRDRDSQVRLTDLARLILLQGYMPPVIGWNQSMKEHGDGVAVHDYFTATLPNDMLLRAGVGSECNGQSGKDDCGGNDGAGFHDWPLR